MPNKAHTLPPCAPLRIGITGGIACGKSWLCRRIEQAGHRVFYCDDEAKRIIRSHPDVRRELTALVGPALYDADGTLNKPLLAAYLCRGREYAARVNAIVHPRVAEAFEKVCAEAARATDEATLEETGAAESVPVHEFTFPDRELTFENLSSPSPRRTVFMECALLFESGFDRLVHYAVTVHISEALQIERVMRRDHITEEQARHWLGLQLTEAERMEKADYFISGELS